jgi:hypothetical protein
MIYDGLRHGETEIPDDTHETVSGRSLAMKRRLASLCILGLAAGAAALLFTGSASAQYTPWLYWTLLPKEQIDLIVGEASGETALATIQDLDSYYQNRSHEEFAGTLLESEVLMKRLKLYGFANAELIKYPAGETWDAVSGSLWEVKPGLRKLVSTDDHINSLAQGSVDTDVTAELIWVGRGTPPEIDAAKVEGKIVVTEGSLGSVHTYACGQKGALGVVAISLSRPYFDPLQISPSGVTVRRAPQGGGQRGGQPPAGQAPPAQPAPEPKFGFQVNVREGDILKQRLTMGEKITAKAKVDTAMEKYNLEVITASIPGIDPSAGEVIFSAHLYEGIIKQGANDNISGSAGILEAARVLNTLINDGRLPKPKRTIRFVWGPEFSGIGRWVGEHREIMARTLCNINMDMVGEWLSKNQAFFCLMRTTFANPHYLNDVMENYYRYVGEGNRERIQNRSGAMKVPVRIVAPFGADEPFWYSIETHYGASDHEVFNDWGVGVPGIMMIAWPDKWYHTTGDTADKSDATQMKRISLIGAAGAYTIASADDAMAVRIAGETASNAARRLGHQVVVGLEKINAADATGQAEAYAAARALVEAAVINEKETLDSTLQLVADKASVGAYLAQLKKSVDALGAAHLATLQAHMEATAKKFGAKPVVLPPLSDEEKAAAKVFPKATAKVKQEGYQGWSKLLQGVAADARAKYPYQGEVSDANELQRLCNGKRSVLDLKKMLDAQSQRKSTIKGIMNYLQILKLAGLVEF